MGVYDFGFAKIGIGAICAAGIYISYLIIVLIRLRKRQKDHGELK